MSPDESDETDRLIDRVASGDSQAVGELMRLHRDRLRKMVAVRLDRRLANRVDPSDVVQETLAEAYKRFPKYLETREIAFYPWLRQLAWNRLTDLYRFHLTAQKRDAGREIKAAVALSDESVIQLANGLTAGGSSPSHNLMRHEIRTRVRSALEQVPDHYREVVIMRHLEQLTLEEISVVADIPLGTVKSRLYRGIDLLQQLLES